MLCCFGKFINNSLKVDYLQCRNNNSRARRCFVLMSEILRYWRKSDSQPYPMLKNSIKMIMHSSIPENFLQLCPLAKGKIVNSKVSKIASLKSIEPIIKIDKLEHLLSPEYLHFSILKSVTSITIVDFLLQIYFMWYDFTFLKKEIQIVHFFLSNICWKASMFL